MPIDAVCCTLAVDANAGMGGARSDDARVRVGSTVYAALGVRAIELGVAVFPHNAVSSPRVYEPQDTGVAALSFDSNGVAA
jgi:hypothetical protein